MRIQKSFAIACLLPAALVNQLTAAASADKSQYTLFKPTPVELMREMVSDQAMFTLTPYTVDAGHFQWETDVLDYFHDRDRSDGADVLMTGWALGRMTLKAGLCDRVDLEASFSAYSEFTTKDRMAGTKTVARGFGNLSTQFKLNLWGNEGGATALAVLPYVTFPTTQLTPGYKDYNGGIQVPFLVRMPCGVRLGLMTGFDLSEDDANRVQASYVNGISLRGRLAGKLDGFAEFFTQVDQDTGVWSGTVNAGVAYQLTKNIEVQVGTTFGVHNDIDYNPYFGFSWRY